MYVVIPEGQKLDANPFGCVFDNFQSADKFVRHLRRYNEKMPSGPMTLAAFNEAQQAFYNGHPYPAFWWATDFVIAPVEYNIEMKET